MNGALQTVILGPARHAQGLLDNAVQQMCISVLKSQKLRRFDFVAYHLSDECVKSVALLLDKNPSINFLNISENPVTDEGRIRNAKTFGFLLLFCFH